MRILFLTDSIDSNSGFGTVSRNIIENLCNGNVKNDLEIAHLAWQWTGRKIDYYKKGWEKSFTQYPIHKHKFGADSIAKVLKDFKPDILWTLGDFWMVNWLAEANYQRLLKEMSVKWYCYIPIDSDIIPFNFRGMLPVVDKVIAMSLAGGEVLKKEHPEMEHWVIPHGVKTDVFKPYTEEERNDIRKKDGYLDKFVIGCVGRNQDRKQHNRLVMAFAKFAKDKEDVFLHFHNDPSDPANMIAGFNGEQYPFLLTVINMLNVGYKVGFTKGITYMDSLPEVELNRLYNTFHIHALATTGEGFGLPIIESNSAGIPNIVTDFTSSPELIKGHGELVKVKTLQAGTFGTWRAFIDIDDMVEKFEKMYKDWKEDDSKLRIEYGKNARIHALKYDWIKNIVPEWIKLFNDSI